MPRTDTNNDSVALALNALVWTLDDSDRASRLLGVTGLNPDDLRSRAGDPALLAAVLGFLEAHEPDLVACAEDIETTPAALVAAARDLERT